MKVFVFFFLTALVLVSARPQNDVVITSYTNENIGVDGYSFGYEQSDGTAHQETGELKNAGSENEAMSVRGSFTFKGADGVVYTVNYVADENGFQPEGAHIPK
ncbi:endocuticle structural glycoprotein ABD-5-like [Ischnura elegans]|uniref:endocuticle structural glycoprotein ABD-5-like n=1 Tax=Ischnura elegans TaxID=197161 RepID=UPI001ED87A87|nr:endocuticle structural glycoprotein ABD-5-like [Ischnura elegans]